MSRIPDRTSRNYSELYAALGYAFVDEALLTLALTHCSYDGVVNRNNQRMEYLGDAVLELAVSDRIYHTCTQKNEGSMTRMRARIVCEESLCQVARKLHLGSFLRLGKGEESSGGREKSSILADAVESVIGAIYLESGMDAAKACVLRLLDEALQESAQENIGFDYKTELQKIAACKYATVPVYQQVDCTGPAHERVFTMRVCLLDREVGRGVGRSKKEAEQKAAQEAAKLLAMPETI